MVCERPNEDLSCSVPTVLEHPPFTASERGEIKLMDIRMAATALASAASAGAPIPGKQMQAAVLTVCEVLDWQGRAVYDLYQHHQAALSQAEGTANP
jgi:hypothetical protein